MTNIINLLSSKPIVFVVENEKLVIKPSGFIAYVPYSIKEAGEIAVGDFKIPISTEFDYSVKDLPEPKENTIYIVSELVARNVPDRQDVFFPDCLAKDKNGRIIGIAGLGKINKI